MRRHRLRADDAPLLAWGEALQAAKHRRARLRRRGFVALTGLALLLATAASPPALRLVWNASASAPIGLYAVAPGVTPRPGDMVIARLPGAFRQLAAARGYLPADVPLVKQVAAAAGDDVCAFGGGIFIDGVAAARRREADGRGRAMPRWSGCVHLSDRQVFLLTDDLASFDGRYFGVSEQADVIGRVRLLWRW